MTNYMQKCSIDNPVKRLNVLTKSGRLKAIHLDYVKSYGSHDGPMPGRMDWYESRLKNGNLVLLERFSQYEKGRGRWMAWRPDGSRATVLNDLREER